jgi:uncharacterized membrane protein
VSESQGGGQLNFPEGQLHPGEDQQPIPGLQLRAEQVSLRGPLPPSSEFGGYETVLAGSAERILNMAEENHAHLHRMDDAEVEHRTTVLEEAGRATKRAQYLVFITVVLFLGVAALAVVLGQPITASILGGGAFLTLGGTVAGATILSRRGSSGGDTPK